MLITDIMWVIIKGIFPLTVTGKCYLQVLNAFHLPESNVLNIYRSLNQFLVNVNVQSVAFMKESSVLEDTTVS